MMYLYLFIIWYAIGYVGSAMRNAYWVDKFSILYHSGNIDNPKFEQYSVFRQNMCSLGWALFGPIELLTSLNLHSNCGFNWWLTQKAFDDKFRTTDHYKTWLFIKNSGLKL